MDEFNITMNKGVEEHFVTYVQLYTCKNRSYKN